MPSRAVKIVAVACLSVLVLSACERKPAPAKPPVSTPAAQPPATSSLLEGFSHEAAFDAQGYYVAVTPIISGNLKLRQIIFGAPSDFAQWERGAKEAAFGPILLVFEDRNSAAANNKVGEDEPPVVVQVLPTAYRFTSKGVSFRAADPKAGVISFAGAIDPQVVRQVQSAGSGESRVALTGTLKIGDLSFESARFTYVMGD